MQISVYKLGGDGDEIHWLHVAPAPIVAALAAILNFVWRRQIWKIVAFVASYLAVISKFGSSCLLRPVIETVKVAVLKLYSESAPISTSNKTENSHKYSDVLECQVLHDPAERSCDVIFIHGLHGSLFNTWRQGNWASKSSPIKKIHRAFRLNEDLKQECETGHDREPYATCWPRDWLPQDVPGARVIALNYTTDPYLWRPFWITQQFRSDMVYRCREMARLLIARGVGSHPIIWVAHSKGGLFVKQMLVEGWELEGREYPLVRATRGILFYSVPHRGSALAHIDPPLFRQSVEIIEVKKDSPQVLDLHSRFLKLCENELHIRPEIISFYETRMTLLSVVYLRIVSPDSADPNIGELCGVDLDHRQICKPRSRRCFLYVTLTRMIDRVIATSQQQLSN